MRRQLAERLREWRARRGLSLGALARRAGVAKGTLCGWERGLHWPRLPELEAVLAALTVSPAERQEALALMRTPRAERSLALLCAVVCEGMEPRAQPVPGHLLQALRLRRGLTLEAAARAAGVSRFALSRWEHSESIPSPARLQTLLEVLDARPAERLALGTGRRHLLPLAAGSPPSLEALQYRWEELESCALSDDRELVDLEFLAWQTQVWPLAARSGRARELLAWGWASYAMWLTWEDRRREAGVFAQRAIALARAERRRTGSLLDTLERAVHVGGLVIAHGKARAARAAAVEWLEMWLPDAAGSRWEIALCRDMAENAWWAGRPSAAFALSDRACCLAERLDDVETARLCRGVRADLFLRSGQPREALALLTPPEVHDFPLQQILESLRWVCGLRALGDRAAADRLAEAYSLIERYGYPQFRAPADALAREL